MILEKLKIIFLMPPKTASNSINESFKKINLEFTNHQFNAPKIHLFLSEIKELYGIVNINDYKIVQVVRDPYTRFISCYYHQLRMLKNIESNLDSLSFDEFVIHLKDCLLSKKDFLQRFYGRVDFIEKLKQKQNNWGGTRLFLNQNQWNDMGADVKYFKIENISKDISPLSDFLGVDLKNLTLVNSFKNKDDLYNDETKNIVRQIYKNDFELYNYQI